MSVVGIITTQNNIIEIEEKYKVIKLMKNIIIITKEKCK